MECTLQLANSEKAANNVQKVLTGLNHPFRKSRLAAGFVIQSGISEEIVFNILETLVYAGLVHKTFKLSFDRTKNNVFYKLKSRN